MNPVLKDAKSVRKRVNVINAWKMHIEMVINASAKQDSYIIPLKIHVYKTVHFVNIYHNLEIIIKKQKKCVEFSLCSNCNKAKGCMKCKENAIYIQETKNCTCQNGYFHSKPKEICKKCHSLCKSCFGPSNQECFRCFRNNYTQYIEETNTCECKGDFMFDDESQQCIKKTPYKIIEKGNTSYSFNKSFDYCEKGYKLSNAKHCEGIR